MRLRFSAFLFPFFSLSALLSGNPNQPGLETDGVFITPPSWCSLRISYFNDNVYQQSFKDEFQIEGQPSLTTSAKILTNATTFTLDFRNRIDLYGILGATQLQLDREVFCKESFCWGMGLKIAFIQMSDFGVGFDIKYFESDQKPVYFMAQGYAYNIASQSTIKYSETQGALGMSYRYKRIAPYINATYLVSKIDPSPMTVLVYLPTEDGLTDATFPSVVGSRRWGMAVGASIIDLSKITLTVESRFFNQNGIDVNCEMRF